MKNNRKIELFKYIKKQIEKEKQIRYFKSCLTPRAVKEFKKLKYNIDNDAAGLLSNLNDLGWKQPLGRSRLESKTSSAHLVLSENGYVLPKITQSPEILKEEESFLYGLGGITAKNIFENDKKRIEFCNRDWETKPFLCYDVVEYNRFIETAHALGYMLSVKPIDIDLIYPNSNQKSLKGNNKKI